MSSSTASLPCAVCKTLETGTAIVQMHATQHIMLMPTTPRHRHRHAQKCLCSLCSNAFSKNHCTLPLLKIHNISLTTSWRLPDSSRATTQWQCKNTAAPHHYSHCSCCSTPSKQCLQRTMQCSAVLCSVVSGHASCIAQMHAATYIAALGDLYTGPTTLSVLRAGGWRLICCWWCCCWLLGC